MRRIIRTISITALTMWSVLALTGSAQAATISLSEDWQAATGSYWYDNTLHGNWRSVFNGYGTNGIEYDASATAGSKVLRQSPKASTRPDETHASLVVSRKSFGNFDMSVKMRTVRQLRTPAPNAWEVGWLLWHYTDNEHFYYVALKPNGWEIGKEDPAYPGAQRFISTGSSPTYPVTQWHTVRVKQVGSTVTVWANGVALATFTDSERPYTTGAVGLYNEDAHVRFDLIRVATL